MNKVNVKRFIPLLISLFALCFALSWIGAAPKARAEGETEPSVGKYTFAEGEFAMADGASVRLAGDANGLRFLAGFRSGFDMSKVTGFGMLIGPKDLVEGTLDETDVEKGAAVDIKYSAEEAEKYLFRAEGQDGVEYEVFGGSLTNVYINNYNRDFVGLAYYETEEGRTYAAANEGENVRSLTYVAEKIIEGGKLETYGGTARALIESYSDKYQVMNGSFAYGMAGWLSDGENGRELGFVVGRENKFAGAEYGYMCDDYGTESEYVYSFVNTDKINEGTEQSEKEINHEKVTGTLTSSPFVVKEGAWLTFSWGGGVNGDVLLKICSAEDDSVLAVYDNLYQNAGPLQGRTLKRTVDLSEFAGRAAYLVFEDNSTVNYGGIVVSDIVTNATECPANAMELAPQGSYFKNAGFEEGTFSGWTVIDGDAFKEEYIDGSEATFWESARSFDAAGTKFLRGEKDEGATGTIRSDTFTLGGDGYVSFLFGGGGNKEVYVQFVAENGEVLKKVTNDAFKDPVMSNNMNRVFIDLHEHIGKRIYIEIVDNATSGFGFANVDDFCVSLTYREALRLLNETKAWAAALPIDPDGPTDGDSQNAQNVYLREYYGNYELPFSLN